ncbi:MAG: Crp/Fnr family transcriptional regulator [Acidiferrobacteraceae bacterium]
MDRKDLRDLLDIGTVRHYKKGELIFRAGDLGDNIHLLRRGRAKIYQISTLGRQVILWFCFPGEIFGLAEMATGARRVVNAQACENTDTVCVARQHFRSYIECHAKAASLVTEILSCRLRVSSDTLVNLIDDHAMIRVIKLILRLGTCYGAIVDDEIHLNVRMTHQEIADMVGATRQTVTMILNQLKRDGLLGINNHQIHIKKRDLLCKMAQSVC